MPVPYVDYSTETRIDSIPFTAPKDLFVLAAIVAAATNMGCVMYVNNKRVGQNNNLSACTIGFFVRKGDVITKSELGEVAYCYVYDIKWK